MRQDREKVLKTSASQCRKYMPTYPYTKQPLADQWAINVHMMHLLRKRYS